MIHKNMPELAPGGLNALVFSLRSTCSDVTPVRKVQGGRRALPYLELLAGRPSLVNPAQRGRSDLTLIAAHPPATVRRTFLVFPVLFAD